MKCPKHIEDALLKRANCASRFMEHDLTIARFLEKHDIEVNDYDIYGGCEAYGNPDASSRRIYDGILAKEC